ncbi:hypothetical protein BDR03DRAFT_963711 [Suillus americanus]|nr:hypothetical protein BDR03DRAFT_963711 [Suillus americanus]
MVVTCLSLASVQAFYSTCRQSARSTSTSLLRSPQASTATYNGVLRLYSTILWICGLERWPVIMIFGRVASLSDTVTATSRSATCRNSNQHEHWQQKS